MNINDISADAERRDGVDMNMFYGQFKKRNKKSPSEVHLNPADFRLIRHMKISPNEQQINNTTGL